MIGGRVFDVSALTDYASGHTFYTRSLVSVAERTGGLVLAVPAAALLDARGRLCMDERAVLDQLRELAFVVVDELSTVTARRAGDLLAQSRARPVDDAVVAAQVAFSARTRGWPVITSGPERLLALDAALDIELLP